MILWLDPGHGPGDGAESGEFLEHRIVYDLAEQVQEQMFHLGVTALVSRLHGEDPSLRARAQKAKRLEVTATLLLHCDTGKGEHSCLYYRRPSVFSATPWSTPFGKAQVFCTEKIDWGQRAANCLLPYDALRIPAVLLEIAYLDNPKHQALLSTTVGLESLARSITNWAAPLVVSL